MDRRAITRLALLAAAAAGAVAVAVHLDHGDAAAPTGPGTYVAAPGLAAPQVTVRADAQADLERTLTPPPRRDDGSQPIDNPANMIDESKPHSHVVDPDTGRSLTTDALGRVSTTSTSTRAGLCASRPRVTRTSRRPRRSPCSSRSPPRSPPTIRPRTGSPARCGPPAASGSVVHRSCFSAGRPGRLAGSRWRRCAPVRTARCREPCSPRARSLFRWDFRGDSEHAAARSAAVSVG